uniref:Putative secreted protein n=1 Tax=Anopheles darlingi TaxID=43151 RepID=A0A2M4D777_ANODA
MLSLYRKYKLHLINILVLSSHAGLAVTESRCRKQTLKRRATVHSPASQEGAAVCSRCVVGNSGPARPQGEQ